MYNVEITFTAMEDLARLPAMKHTKLLKQINAILESSPIPKGKPKKSTRYRLKIGTTTILYTVNGENVRIVAIY